MDRKNKFKIGDIVKSKYGVMHTVAYVNDEHIYFVEGKAIIEVDNEPNDWEICYKGELFDFSEVLDNE